MKKITLLLITLCCSLVLHAVTFNVTVPAKTKDCYVVGDFNGWSPTDAPKMLPDGENKFTLDLPDVTEAMVAKGFKYICGTDWMYVEKDASGNEINNRTSLIGNVVEKWADVPVGYTEYVEFDFPHGMKKREIRILLPPGYEANPEKQYPVIYMHGVRQAYHDGGAENNGDDFFASRSWAVAETMEQMHADGKETPVVVAMYGFLPELSPWENNEYMGTGKADEFLSIFKEQIMPLISSKYRISAEAENTTIMGADMGGLFAYYAALKYPDTFGKIALFSPSFWFNKSQLQSFVSSWNKTGGQKMYFMAGSKEGAEYKDNTKLFYEMTKEKGFDDSDIGFMEISNGMHDDISWRNQFGIAYSFLQGEPVDIVSDYQYMQHSDTEGVVCTGNQPFEKINFYTDGTAESAVPETFIHVDVIPADFVPVGTNEKKYYYNVNKGSDCTGGNLLAANMSVTFKKQKSTVSWSRSVIDTETNKVNSVNVSKDHFVVTVGSTDYPMVQTKEDGTPGEDNTFTVSSGDIDFSVLKEFTIYYGSVNSGSKMTADPLVSAFTVPVDCLKAQIIYSFKTNRITVNKLESSDMDFRFMEMDSETSETGNCYVNEALTDVVFYAKGASEPANVKVYIKEVPLSSPNNYFWNLNIGTDCNGDLFIDGGKNKKVGFSSSRSYVSWIRVVVDQTPAMEDIAASSEFFRVYLSNGKNTQLKRTKADGTDGSDDTYTVSGEVDFMGESKSFEIYFGSVNSGSKMSSLTNPVSVTERCSKAQVIYSFKTNKVTVIETEWNDDGSLPQPDPDPDGPAIVSFTAVPSYCKAGTPVKISSSGIDMTGYDVSYEIVYNYGNNQSVQTTIQPAVLNGNGVYEYTLNDTKSGIYTINIIATKGGNTLEKTPAINIKVPMSEGHQNVEKEVTTNPYEGINWETTGQYKGNFHTHTYQSFDSDVYTHTVIDRYHSKGYKILALTDHDINTYPWTMLSSFNNVLENRDPSSLDMLTFPGIELSKSNRNSWDEVNGPSKAPQFNHHNDFFTGRKGQEAGSLQESYAYTQELGGLQLINHPGQYWKPKKNDPYNNEAFEKNSPAWHARNFQTYESLIGLEVYNQGDRWVHDRMLWDDILERTMPEKAIFGYSNDDSHDSTQFFRNYQFMLMDELSIPALKETMKKGATYFSYEKEGSGQALAPRINSITVDNTLKTITIDATNRSIYWISGIDENPESNDLAKSTVIGYGNTFYFEGFQGKYVRAFIVNTNGETCTQPFGFNNKDAVNIIETKEEITDLHIFPNPAKDYVTIQSGALVNEMSLFTIGGQLILKKRVSPAQETTLNLHNVPNGIYVIKVQTDTFTANKLLHVYK